MLFGNETHDKSKHARQTDPKHSAPSVKQKFEDEKDSEGKFVVTFVDSSHIPDQDEIGRKTHANLGDWLAKGIVVVSGPSWIWNI